jgi:hypothetical protein
MFEQLAAWLNETDARFPFPNPQFNEEQYAAEHLGTREVTLPNLEREHAAVLQPDWSPQSGWWEDKAKQQ